MIIFLIYVAIFVIAFFAVKLVASRLTQAHDFTSLKTVTFGDESAITADRAASVISVVAIFLIWAAFTGSSLSPLHAPGPFVGEASFTYTAEAPDGSRDDGTVSVVVFPVDAPADVPEVEPGDGFAKNDAARVERQAPTLAASFLANPVPASTSGTSASSSTGNTRIWTVASSRAPSAVSAV